MKFCRVVLSLLLTCVLIVLFANSTFAVNYYIRNGGNDSASGLNDGNAWASIAKINEFARTTGFKSGDTINLKRGSVWSNDEPLGWGIYPYQWGTINGLTIRDYGSGSLPRLNSNTQQAIFISSPTIFNLTIRNIDVSGFDWEENGNFPKDANLRVHAVNGVVIDGIYCDGHKGSKSIYDKNSYIQHKAIALSGIEGDIEIMNCTILNVMKDTLAHSIESWGEAGPTGIVIWYRPANDIPKTSGTILIHDNVIKKIYADCIQTGGIRTITKIYNNKLSHFGENALDLKVAKFFDIHHNEFFWENFGSSTGAGFLGASAVIAGQASDLWPSFNPEDIILRDNYFHDISTRAISVSGSNWKIYGNYFKDVGIGVHIRLNGSTVHDNLFELTKPLINEPPYSTSHVYRSGIYFDVSSHTRNNRVYNNTMYISSPNHEYGIGIQSRSGQYGNQIEKNIVYMTGNSSSIFPLYLQDWDNSNTYPEVENNCFYNPNNSNRVYWDKVVYSSKDLNQYVNDVDSSAKFADPMFLGVDTGNYYLHPDSPCILFGYELGAKLPLSFYSKGVPPPISLKLIE